METSSSNITVVRGGLTRRSRVSLVASALKQVATRGANSVSPKNWEFIRSVLIAGCDTDLLNCVQRARFPRRYQAQQRAKNAGAF